jgi:hypothetical protein
MTTCIPVATGVPGLFGPPNWWDTGGSAPPLRNIIDDPRWVGAASQGFGYGTGLEAEFRALYATDWLGKTSLFLSWHVVYDGALNDGLDRLYVGFAPTGITPLIIEVIAYTSSSSDLTDQFAGTIQAYQLDDATGSVTPLGSTPAWLNTTRVWLTRNPITWAITMRVPINPLATQPTDPDGLNLASTFSMFYELYVLTPTRVDTSPATGGFVVHKWPSGIANIITGVAGDIIPHPVAGNWEQFQYGSTCTGGISLDLWNIGTTNTPTSKILYKAGGGGPTNTIFANPLNKTGSTIPVGAITARFRIADWGSVIMDPNAPWDDIRGGGAVPNAQPIVDSNPQLTYSSPPNSPPLPNPPISFTWQLNNTEAAPYAGGKPSDQCMLVELSGAGLTFSNNSIRRNMDFVPASIFQRTAQINIVGLTPIAGGGPTRDVYLAVETLNMPAVAPPPGRGNGGTRGMPVPPQGDGPQRPVPPARGVNRQALSAARTTGGGGGPQTGDAQPTYRVHVYHDTGDRITINAVTYPILAPQSSFGYFLDHQGPLAGWRHNVQAPPSAQLRQIALNFYKVVVPNNGAIRVTNTIEAVEHSGCLGQLLAILAWIVQIIQSLLRRLRP